MNLKILIIDDHDISSIGLKKLLSKKLIASFKIHRTYKETIQDPNLNEYDLIISDYSLFDKNGIDLLKTIKKKNLNAKKILMTSFEEENIIELAKKEKIDGLIFKSESKEEILTQINKVLSGELVYPSIKSSQNNFIWNHDSNPFLKLTKKEIEVLKDLVLSISIKDSAIKLKISQRTLSTHRLNLKKKLSLKKSEIINQARRWKLV